MKLLRPFRLSPGAAFVALLALGQAFAFGFGQKIQQPKPNLPAQRTQPQPAFRPAPRPEIQSAPAPEVRSTPAPVFRSSPGPIVRNPNPGIGPHIEQWMENHKNLPPADQERALQTLPGFSELPGQTQQRYRQQLRVLNNMNPEQRSRILNGVEGLERLSPQQQQQWGRAVQQVHALPPQRRALMMTAVRDLRTMPADQRQQVIDSPAFGNQFSPEERTTIHTILTAY